MITIKDIINVSTSVDALDKFINENSMEIFDFFISQNNNGILQYRDEIESYIFPKYSIYSKLDYSKIDNQSFLYCLIDVSQRFGLSSEFESLYQVAKRNNVELNSRIEATSKFLIGIKKISDYESRINRILALLKENYLEEEDNENKSIATIIYFYHEVIFNFNHNIEGVSRFKDFLIKELSTKDYSLLFTDSLKEVLDYSLENIEKANQFFHDKIDEILDRSDLFASLNSSHYLIESNTTFVNKLSNIDKSFNSIKQLNTTLYSEIASREIFDSLQRGVGILKEENQLLAYLNSFGNMHQAKMLSALNSVEDINDLNNIEVYDWGCGQALASVCLLEYFNNNDFYGKLNNVTLIEPSEIAIKRGALYVNKFKSDIDIFTINKDLDSLIDSDLCSNVNNTKIHLFSNILDVELFSMPDFIEFIKTNFKGNNLFICVSPYISDIKTHRIDSFVNEFKEYLNFNMYSDISERKGEWPGTNWSRVIRVFSFSI